MILSQNTYGFDWLELMRQAVPIALLTIISVLGIALVVYRIFRRQRGSITDPNP
jgi:hypothetical protein